MRCAPPPPMAGGSIWISHLNHFPGWLASLPPRPLGVALPLATQFAPRLSYTRAIIHLPSLIVTGLLNETSVLCVSIAPACPWRYSSQ